MIERQLSRKIYIILLMLILFTFNNMGAIQAGEKEIYSKPKTDFVFINDFNAIGLAEKMEITPDILNNFDILVEGWRNKDRNCNIHLLYNDKSSNFFYLAVETDQVFRGGKLKESIKITDINFLAGEKASTFNFKLGKGLVGNMQRQKYNYEKIYELLSDSVTNISINPTEGELSKLDGLFRLFCTKYNDDAKTILASKQGTGGYILFHPDKKYTSDKKTEEFQGIKVQMKKGMPVYTLNSSTKESMEIGIEFMEVLKAVNKGGKLDKFSALKTITTIAEEIQGTSDQVAIDAEGKKTEEVIEASKREWGAMTAFQRFTNVVRIYLLKDEKDLDLYLKDIGTEAKGFGINDFESFKEGTEDSKKDSLSKEERLRLQAYYFLLNKLSTSTKKQINGFIYPVSGEKIESSGRGHDISKVKMSAEEAVSNTAALSIASGSIKDVALNFYEISRYQTAKVYGYEVDNGMTASPAPSASPSQTPVPSSSPSPTPNPLPSPFFPLPNWPNLPNLPAKPGPVKTALTISVVGVNSAQSTAATPSPSPSPSPSKTPQGSVTTASFDKITTSDFLEKVSANSEYSLGDVLTTSIDLPKMEKVATIAKDTGYKPYLDLQYNLLALATYASQYAGIEEIDKNGVPTYTNQALDKFILDNKVEPTSVSMSDDMKEIITAYIQIYKGLDYLGVKPYSEELKVIYNYYTKISAFEENKDLQDYNPADASLEPLNTFFSVETKKLSKNYNIGVALSSTYIPMKTNTYDVSSIACLEDAKFIPDFHYAYGFNRKVLYIDTNVNAAVDQYVTGKKGSLRVATLNDMLSPEKDIVLYIDDNFYNVKKLAEMQGFSYNKMANTDEAGKEKTDFMADIWGEWLDTNVENITKTGAVTKYSNVIQKNVVEFGKKKKVLDGKSKDDYILSQEGIQTYLDTENYEEYTPLQGFAVVSAIYRHPALYKLLNKSSTKQSPVFVSSPNLAGITGIKQGEFNSIFNYVMLKNLQGNMGIDYKTALDLGSPIYMDLYGNIVTESGLVIIPAASNPTIQKPNKYSVYNAGFISLYDNGIYKIPASFDPSDKWLKLWFEKNEETQTWELNNKRIGGTKNKVYMNFNELPVSDEKVLKTFQSLYIQQMNEGCIDFSSRCYLITEVLRGAPIENIDTEVEGINGNRSINKYGVYIAYKLDELSKALMSNTNGNSVVTLPNLAYMEGVEYVVLFGYKLLFAFMVIMLFYKVYSDAVTGGLGLKTFTHFILTLVLFVMVAFSIPLLMDFSYYQANRGLLQEEVEHIALLNLEKTGEGREIGVYDVTTPETTTTLYVKIDELSIPWYDILDDILLSNAFATMEEIYDHAFSSNLMSSLPGVIKKSNGLYMDINYIFNTSVVEYNTERNAIFHRVLETPYASYAMPYYAILDQLTMRVNTYNLQNNIKSYSTKIQGRGAVKTVGMIEAYLTSDTFMLNSQDVLGMKNIYGVETSLVEDTFFTTENLNQMKDSLWYADNGLSEEALNRKLDKLDTEARNFVTKNRKLLTKVTDETFLKVMALSLSLEHNRIFKVPSCKSIEVFDIDSKDIMRLSLAERKIVMNDSSKSFARFVYDNGGTLGVIATACLVATYFISALIKPVCIFIILGCMIVSLLIKKLLRRDNNKAIEGYLITMTLLCGTNFIYALCLKFSMSLPSYKLTMPVNIVVQIVIQVLYILILLLFTVWILKDSSNMGFSHYERMMHSIQISGIRIADMVADKLKINKNTMTDEYDIDKERRYTKQRRKTKGLTGSEFYHMMKERDEKREAEYERENGEGED